VAELYFDNLHKQLYAKESSVETTGSLLNDQITFGLSDLTELPGQSTWYIRSILFKATGYSDLLGTSPYSLVSFNAGISSRDISATTRPGIDDYQDIAGWPLKSVYTEMMVQNTPQQNGFSFQKLFKPSKNLTLNREQNIQFNIRNMFGNTLISRLLIYVHAERGD